MFQIPKAVDDIKLSFDVGEGDSQCLELFKDGIHKDSIHLSVMRHSKVPTKDFCVIDVGVACSGAEYASMGRQGGVKAVSVLEISLESLEI